MAPPSAEAGLSPDSPYTLPVAEVPYLAPRLDLVLDQRHGVRPDILSSSVFDSRRGRRGSSGRHHLATLGALDGRCGRNVLADSCRGLVRSLLGRGGPGGVCVPVAVALPVLERLLFALRFLCLRVFDLVCLVLVVHLEVGFEGVDENGRAQDLDLLFWLVRRRALHPLHQVEDVEPPDDAPEDRVLVVQVRTRLERDEELRAVGVEPRVGHAEQAAPFEAETGVEFVIEFAAPAALSAFAGAGRVAALDHEVLDHPMEAHPVVVPLVAEGEEVLSSHGREVRANLQVQVPEVRPHLDIALLADLAHDGVLLLRQLLGAHHLLLDCGGHVARGGREGHGHRPARHPHLALHLPVCLSFLHL
mmetsp:Transcript_4898/g.12065  ORF Transcript_4898/g.12065 Transcript_4898/m.12065 type:complete len:361 (-) Transcript_4898:789-1871(-)